MYSALAEQGNEAGFFDGLAQRQPDFPWVLRKFLPLDFLQIDQHILSQFPRLRASIQNEAHRMQKQFLLKKHKFNEKGVRIAIFYDIL